MLNEDFIAFTGDTGDFELLQKDENFANLLQLFPNVNSILIPKKAEYNLRKYVSKKSLKGIDPDINIAVEKCLVMLSNLVDTFYKEDNHLEENRWKRLHSKILDKQFGGNNDYIKIIETLKEGTSTGTMLEVVEDEIANVQCRRYRVPESYFKVGLVNYTIKDNKMIQKRNKFYYKQLIEALDNPVCKNLISIYPKIDLPTKEHLLSIGKQLVKNNHFTKKGKKLTMRNKHKNDYWSDFTNRSFVEDNIELFEFLTKRGFMIPTAGNDNSGGRVVDSFTLMPSWIRNEITIDGNKLIECDYKALHPNIAISLYNGKQRFITHDYIAEKTGINLKDVKIEHLSFFNKEWQMMVKSSIYNFYFKNELEMLTNINKDKRDNGYKITSKKMLTVEVAIMTDVVKYLNTIGISVIYVYDALFCEEKDQALVIETMNRIVQEHGVITKVKSDLINDVLIKEDLLANSNGYLSKEEIKELLREMINQFEYENQKSAINLMLYNMENKSIEYYNEMYLFIKNKKILSVGKTE